MIPQLKPIDPSQKIYHLFKLSTILYVLYDDLMDRPIQYGSLNKIQPTANSIKNNIKGSITIYYDKDITDNTISFKKNPLKTRMNNNK